MTSDLYTLAYFSRNAADGIGADAHVELGRILASARRNNEKKGVTGALIFSDDHFAQVLEGPLAEIEAIFENIEADPRHSNVTVIHFKPLAARRFGAWSMAFANVPEAGAASLEIGDVLNNPGKAEAYDAERDILGLLEGLLSKHAIDDVH